MNKNSGIKCENCGYTNTITEYFCEKCGHLMGKAMFVNKDLGDIEEYKFKRIIDNLECLPHNKVLWNDVVDTYTKKVERFKALYCIEDLENQRTDALVEKLDDFLDLCSNAEFQIAFVGTIKTGKSTLINSLLGKNYASTSVTPETAVLTKFRSSPKDYIKIKFFTKEEWKKLWDSRTSAADVFVREYNNLNAEIVKDKWTGHSSIYKELTSDEIENELAVWSSSKHAEHYFVKEIEVGISSLPSNFPKQVIFVDTPGLSDPVVYRSDITKEYIRRANAVFVCVDSKKVYKEEVDTIASVFSFSSHNKNKVHIVTTHWDTLNNLNKDWDDQMDYMSEKFVGDAFYDSSNEAKQNIVHSSGYIYNLCRDFDTLSENEKMNLKIFAMKLGIIAMDDSILRDNLEFLKEKTNIATVMKVIQNRLFSNYKSILYQDIEMSYQDICLSVDRVSNERVEGIKGLIEATDSDQDTLKQKVKKHKQNVDDIMSAKNQLLSVMKLVESATSKNITVVKDILARRIKSNNVKKG